VDLSDASRRALTFADGLCRRVGATMEILHVWSAPWVLAGGALEGSIAHEQVISSLSGAEKHAGDALRAFVAAAELLGPQPRLVLQPGSPAEHILTAARDGRFDLIVMGTHGRGFFKRMLLGSVAHSVVAKAPCPVIATPGNGRRPEK
jgi:nucleotide-binding universal stress UspA family protein